MDIQGKKRPRAAIYARVSGGPGQTTENQIPLLAGLADQRGFEVTGVFTEVASTLKARPVLDGLVNDARKARIDVVVVFALDRLGRSLAGNLDLLMEFDRCGVDVVSYSEPWLSLRGPVRSLLIAVFSWVAEQERARIGERARAGLARARARGTRLGRPPVQVDLDRLVEMRGQGLSIREVAKALRIGASTAHRLLAAHSVLAAACAGSKNLDAEVSL